MDIVHFTPGSLDPENVRKNGTAAIMPLASGNGKIAISCLYLSPRGRISVPPTGHSQLIMTVNGKAQSTFPKGFSPRLFAGVGILLHPGETCQLDSQGGAVIITIEATELEPDPCGISTPERVMGQQWPIFESN
jgi:hypothetical protein